MYRRQGDGFVRAAGVELSPARVAEISDTLIALRAEAAVALGAAKPAQGFDKPEVTVRVERTGPGPKSFRIGVGDAWRGQSIHYAVSYTHLRAHETVLDLVCRLLLEKKHKMRS